jgi:leader peptidase (prepilin peptidase)/N-methyltransferase
MPNLSIPGIFSLVFGLLIGSFLNALIYRLPRDINIALPRSSCPHCKKIIVWYENIPVLSFLFLKGKCSGCGGRISWRYPAIELLTGLVSFALFPISTEWKLILNYLFYFSVFCVFLSHLLIDLEHQILPDSLNIFLGVVIFSYALYYYHWTYWLIGGLVGFLFPLAVTWGFYLLRGQIGLGGGDIKLFGVLGLYLGPLGVIHNIFFSCFLGSIVGISLILFKKMDKKNPIAFGPYIIIVATIQIFFPDFFSGLIII